MKINQNDLAATVTLSEGGARSLPIGQVKEVQRLTLEWLATRPFGDVADLLARVAARAGKRRAKRTRGPVAQPPRR